MAMRFDRRVRGTLIIGNMIFIIGKMIFNSDEWLSTDVSCLLVTRTGIFIDNI